MPSYTREQYERAKNVDLASFLQGRGYELVKDGNRAHKMKNEAGFTVSNNLWCWHSQGRIGGNAIDFLVKYEKMPLVEAVLTLAGDAVQAQPTYQKSPEKQNKDFALPEANENNRRVIAYLNKTRGIDSEIIFDMINKGNIYESKNHNNCVFVGRDNAGSARYAAVRGTNSYAEKAFRHDVENSDKSYGFTMNGKSDKLYVFEAPADALSHASLFKMRGLDWKSDTRISLGGVSNNALERYLSENEKITTLEFCLDNDEAGLNAANNLGETYAAKGYTVYVNPPKHKDYNEELLAVIHGEIQDEGAARASPEACI